MLATADHAVSAVEEALAGDNVSFILKKKIDPKDLRRGGAVEIEKFHSKIYPTTGVEVEKEPEFLQNGDSAIVEMIPKKPMVVETFGECPPLGRFMIRDKEQIAGVGVVKSVEKKDYPDKDKSTKSAVMESCKKFGASMVDGGKKFGNVLVNGSVAAAVQLALHYIN
ncbi:hypothetical protein FEM48_Zijuj07G0060500 [Ziziphus jujuba var. spinosa]|uniref:GTP-eEF1A C-terminal domain-containing protein n=1 Tax=Ziziphus jujuba var. spinosa TaxID=714518 RepID=A0A978V2W6_ZIZJJ|nr:hypothetical protein FEM48_Zijuj07G0060500 [Ziziphus jujuba var. spinosa]